MEINNQENLKKAQFYFESKNYIQSELFIRRLLKENPADRNADILLNKIKFSALTLLLSNVFSFVSLYIFFSFFWHSAIFGLVPILFSTKYKKRI
jgi:hypothetical protein